MCCSERRARVLMRQVVLAIVVFTMMLALPDRALTLLVILGARLYPRVVN